MVKFIIIVVVAIMAVNYVNHKINAVMNDVVHTVSNKMTPDADSAHKAIQQGASMCFTSALEGATK